MTTQTTFWDGVSGPRWEAGSRIGPENWQDGRAELHRLIVTTNKRRYVSVRAPPGTGKSTAIMLDAVRAAREKQPEAQIFYFVKSDREQEWLSTVLDAKDEAQLLLGKQLTVADLRNGGNEDRQAREWFFGTYEDLSVIMIEGLLPSKAMIIIDVDLYMSITFTLLWADLRENTEQVTRDDDA